MKDLFLAIYNIFRGVGRILTAIRNGVFNVLFLVILLAGLVVFLGTRPASIPVNSILQLRLAGDIVEEPRTSSSAEKLISQVLGEEDTPRYTLLQDLLDSIETAAFDPAIVAIVLDLKDLGAIGLDQMQTIGKALEVFRHQSKKVLAAGDFFTQKQYYLAAYADTIMLNPMGGVELHGFGLYPLYFRDALDKLEVNYHIFRVGTYKSAVEPLTRNSMSDEARGQNLEWLSAFWDTYLHDVARQRGLTTDHLTGYVANIADRLTEADGNTAQLALNERLVDLLLTREEMESHLKSITGTSTLNLVSNEDYLEQVERSYSPTDSGQPRIGVIVAEGNILDGKQPAGVIGGDSLAELLREARNDDEVKAVVLRINSGGGSAFASEIIRQEALELKKAGKPLVVSMASMAASGGYWISANADQIWASPVTLTGSIGIFGAIPTFERTLANLGIHSDGVGTTAISAGVNLAQPLTDEVKRSIQLTVNHGYERFLDIVADGRNMSRDKLSEIAEGRVFSGERAMQLGLVDRLGNLEDAIEGAASLAGLKEFEPVYIERPRSLRDEMLHGLATAIGPRLAQSLFPRSILDFMHRFHRQTAAIILQGDPHGLYAHALLQPPQ